MKLCIIPARGGSKRIPKKNIRTFHGKPLISYSISSALNAGCFDEVIVSTDDAEIRDVAIKAGAAVPFMREAGLADDYTTTSSVIKDAILKLAEIGIYGDDVCCLYPTAPFVTPDSINGSYAELNSYDVNYCFSATSFPFPIQRAFSLDSNGNSKMFYPEHKDTRSQDLPEAFHDAGQFYWGKRSSWLEDAPIFGASSRPFILPRHLVQDIDTEEDWKKAELMYSLLRKSGNLK
ncbi:pseudaminic acid cytidylyltransferase [Alteromonas mediterranea]|uniref:pseudaminic acid cytidylyltransferase n=1 Tax=Alteromonas mediterranea TaxID=314275 RepID=UPI00090447CD|nr:pseudaminic acid cytidylyltransferase [Alteromonas mediterranea]APD95386.1 pseudaminic acid cytidylyltransferase [Alteromonas mediterranea]APD99019.1 pseudaminic acid cytidylyltransferase [Alteromonas mediterranea]